MIKYKVTILIYTNKHNPTYEPYYSKRIYVTVDVPNTLGIAEINEGPKENIEYVFWKAVELAKIVHPDFNITDTNVRLFNIELV